MSKKEYDFTSPLSHAVAYTLQRCDRFRTDEKYFRTDLKVETYRNIISWIEDTIEKIEEDEERLELECAVLGNEYK